MGGVTAHPAARRSDPGPAWCTALTRPAPQAVTAARPTFAELWWLLRQAGWHVREEAVTGPPQAPV
jgi:hypothetical protein